MMTSREFNIKYKDYLETGHYGLAIEHEGVIRFLDNIFTDLIQIPDFQYSQIKMKFGMSRFYADGLTSSMCYLIESRINQIINNEKT